MKKLLILIFASLCMVPLGYAQSKSLSKDSVLLKEHRQLINSIMLRQQGRNIAMKSTGLKERAITQAHYDFSIRTDGFTDTAHAVYSGNRSAFFDYNRMAYDFDYLSYNSSIQSDTSVMYVYAGGLIYADNISYSKYDANSNDTDYYYLIYGSGQDFIHEKNKFNAYNNIVSQYSMLKVGLSYDSFSKDFFMYNAANLQLTDSSYSLSSTKKWYLAAVAKNTYDASGNKIEVYSNIYDTTLGLVAEQTKMTYNSDNQLLTSLLYLDGGTGMTLAAADSFTYGAGISYPLTWKEYGSDLSGKYGYGISYYSKVVNAAGLPEAMYEYQWDTTKGWLPQYYDVVKYNSYNDPDSIITYKDSAGTYTTMPAKAAYFYYETYNPTDIKQLTTSKASEIKVYPNPADNIIYITLAGGLQHTALTATISNMAGQIVKTETMVLNNQTGTISVADSIPDTYLVSIRNSVGQRLCTQTIVKR